MRCTINRSKEDAAIYSMLFLLLLTAVQMKNGQIAAVVISFALVVKALTKKKLIIRKSCMLPLSLWLFVICLMIVNTRYWTSETYIEIVWLLVGVGLLFCAGAAQCDIRNSVELALYPTAILCSLNILFYYSIVDLNRIFNKAYAGIRLQGGFDGPNEIAAFLMIVLVYAWMTQIYDRKIKLITPCSIPILICIYLTWSRAAFLTVAIMVVVTCVVFIKRTKKHKFLLLILVAMLLIVAIIIVHSYVIPKLNYVRRNASDRQYIIDVVILAFRYRPILGQGLNSFSQYGYNTSPHSSYFFSIVSGGIIGIAGLVTLYVTILIEAYKRNKMPAFWALITYYIFEQAFNNIIRGRALFIFLFLTFTIYNEESSKLIPGKEEDYEHQRYRSNL